MRRLPVALAALLTLTLAAALAVAGLSSTRSAQAQQTEEFVLIDNFGVDPDAGGYVVLEFPTEWQVWATCNGAYPQAMTAGQVPSSVMSRRPAPYLIVLRLWQPTARVVTSPARVNCTFNIIAPTPTTPTQARQTLQRLAAQQVALGR